MNKQLLLSLLSLFDNGSTSFKYPHFLMVVMNRICRKNKEYYYGLKRQKKNKTMKLELNQIKEIQIAFQKMESKHDFLNLLNVAKTIIYGDKTIPFQVKELNYFINKHRIVREKRIKSNFELDRIFFQGLDPIKTDGYYHVFCIKKKSGEDRILHAPTKGLKEIQKALNIILQCVFEPHKAATGFVWGKSIVDNAKLHINQNYVYNLDLKDFFPSIDQARVWGRIKAAPFHLGRTPERQKIANMIATLCCTTMEVERKIDNQWQKVEKSVLPQGAPTSPILTNAICEKLDVRLTGVAKRFGLNYSRYADDITFSSKHNVTATSNGTYERIFEKDATFDKEVRRIIEEQRFHIKESKVRLQKQGYRQEVTGIVVNEKMNVNQRYVKQLRQWLFNWETYGYEKATEKFLTVYKKDKGHIKKAKPNMALVIEGKLLYLKMVKGAKDATYLKLRERFDRVVELFKTENSNFKKEDNFIDLIFEVGLDEAMNKYII